MHQDHHHTISDRVRAFRIDDADVQRLISNRDILQKILPVALQRSAASFSQWPEIYAALKHPDVARARSDHWNIVGSGELSEPLLVSAERLATILLQHLVPSYAITVCHFAVAEQLTQELATRLRGSHFLGRRSRDRPDFTLLSQSIQKFAWLDLEILLETYAAAERRRDQTLKAELESFNARVEAIVHSVGRCSKEVAEGAKTVAQSVERTGERAASASSSSELSAGTVQAVAGATEQLSASINGVTELVSQAATVARNASSSAGEAQERMNQLCASVDTIDSVVNLIRQIASQTNLLALNATIEAARAGEGGRGFSIVAGEVKELALQTERATKDIAHQISSIQEVATGVDSAVAAIGRVVDEMDKIAALIRDTVEQQRDATQEIARNVSQAALCAREVHENLSGVTDASAASDVASSRMMTISADLSDQAVTLHRAVEELTARSRAA